MLSLGGHQIFRPIQWFECLLAILNFWLPDQGRQFVYAGNFLTTMSGVLDVITNYSRTTGGCDDKHGGKDCLANPCYLKNAESNSNLHKGEHRCNAERGGYGRVTWE